MSRFALVAVGLALILAAPARTQSVEVAPLAAPDVFSLPGRGGRLPPELWRGSSAETVRRALPVLASQPLSQAGRLLTRRVLATGAPGPIGIGNDPDILADRVEALLAIGDAPSVTLILGRASGIERNTALARVAAESALLTGDDARACEVADLLTTGRGNIYWLRLRAFCQAQSGQTDLAHLTFDLAQAQDRDAVFGRLMSAKLLGTGPGEASLRNGLDFALSRSLLLDLARVQLAPAIASAIAGLELQGTPMWNFAGLDPVLAGLAGELASGAALNPVGLSALIAAAEEAGARSQTRLQSAALLAAAVATKLSAQDRSRLAAFAMPGGKALAGRSLALAYAAEQGLMGETALLALWVAADAGAAGPAVGERVRIIRALTAAGLDADARNFAVEGLLGLK